MPLYENRSLTCKIPQVTIACWGVKQHLTPEIFALLKSIENLFVEIVNIDCGGAKIF